MPPNNDTIQLNPHPLLLPIDSLQLASLCLDLAKSQRLLQNGHRLQNFSHRLWSTIRLQPSKLQDQPQLSPCSSLPPVVSVSILPPHPSFPSNLSRLFTSVLSNELLQNIPFSAPSSPSSSSQAPCSVPTRCHSEAQSAPRFGSPSPHPPAPPHLQAPQIFNIAPTPPIASSPIHPPSALAIHSSLPSDQPPTPYHLLSLPHQLADQSSSDCSSNQPSLNCFDPADRDVVKHSRPSLGPHYSSDAATTPSSIGLKSFSTVLSIEARDDHHAQPCPVTQDKKSPPKPHHHLNQSVNVHLPHRRATSTAGLKHKSRPLSFVRLYSHTSSRSASPRLVQPIREIQDSLWMDDLTCHPVTSSSLSPKSVHLSPSDLLNPLSHQPPSSSLQDAKTTPVSSIHQGTKYEQSDSRLVSNDDYGSSTSLPSLVSPIIPVTPNNSRVSAPFRVWDTVIPHSLASSHATGVSSSFLPSAPPSTPAQNGAHLPTTMSATHIKSKPPGQVPVPSLLPAISTAGAGSKKKAKFFIKECEADDERFPSPPSVPSQPTEVQPSRHSIPMPARTPQHTPPASITEPSVVPQNQINQPLPNSGRDSEELDGSDSDEWGSEYSDDECEEDENFKAEVKKLQEVQKKDQDEYYRQLFAKKHFDQRNQSRDGCDPPPPIRRAGLSMLFHPELNHLQHHPRHVQSTDPAPSTAVPVRNQSALELRRQASSSSYSRRPVENALPHASSAHGLRLSLGPIPRPCSLIKSKSSVAVPVLAGHEPPAMIQRSPSIHDAHTTSTRQSQMATPAGDVGKSISSSTAPVVVYQQQQPPTRSLPPQQQNHPRHPSRLGGKPQNVEYSDDDSDSEQGTDSRENFKSEQNIPLTEAQERRLNKLVSKSKISATSSTLPSRIGKTTTPEPILLDMNKSGRPQPIAPPLSPRTTRKNMFATELTESLRRNLIWERQMRAQAFGILLNDSNGPNKNDLMDDNEMMHGEIGNLFNQGIIDPLSRGKKGSNSSNCLSNKKSSSSNNVNKEYRNFSKGFHRTGW